MLNQSKISFDSDEEGCDQILSCPSRHSSHTILYTAAIVYGPPDIAATGSNIVA